MYRDKLTLNFAYSGESIELYEVRFCREDQERELHSVRGKTSGAFRGAGTFQWSAAVKALCVLVLRTIIAARGGRCEPRLIGSRGTLASALDYAVSKRPLWISEMFGTMPSGEAYLRRLLLISNPNLKRPGPAAVSFNERMLQAQRLAVKVDGSEIASLGDLQKLLRMLEASELANGRGIDNHNIHDAMQWKLAS